MRRYAWRSPKETRLAGTHSADPNAALHNKFQHRRNFQRVSAFATSRRTASGRLARPHEVGALAEATLHQATQRLWSREAAMLGRPRIKHGELARLQADADHRALRRSAVLFRVSTN